MEKEIMSALRKQEEYKNKTIKGFKRIPKKYLPAFDEFIRLTALSNYSTGLRDGEFVAFCKIMQRLEREHFTIKQIVSYMKKETKEKRLDRFQRGFF